MLMYSCAAIWASVRPWATRVTSSRSRALSFPGSWRACGCVRVRGGEHQGVLGRGGQAHRRAAFFGRARPAGPSACRGLAQGFSRRRASAGALAHPLAADERGERGPHRDGLGEPPGRGAQVPAAVQAR